MASPASSLPPSSAEGGHRHVGELHVGGATAVDHAIRPQREPARSLGQDENSHPAVAEPCRDQQRVRHLAAEHDLLAPCSTYPALRALRLCWRAAVLVGEGEPAVARRSPPAASPGARPPIPAQQRGRRPARPSRDTARSRGACRTPPSGWRARPRRRRCRRPPAQTADRANRGWRTRPRFRGSSRPRCRRSAERCGSRSARPGISRRCRAG